MDTAPSRKEVSDDLAREYLIGISNTLPDKILGQKPEQTDSSDGSTKDSNEEAEEQRSELISISYDPFPVTPGGVPIAPGRP